MVFVFRMIRQSRSVWSSKIRQSTQLHPREDDSPTAPVQAHLARRNASFHQLADGQPAIQGTTPFRIPSHPHTHTRSHESRSLLSYLLATSGRF
jgi:hypothetical protein